MPDLESDLRRIAAERAETERREIIDAQRNVAGELAQQAKKLNDLLDNPLMKWFTETHLAPLVAKEATNALDVSRSKDERDASAQRHDIAKTMLEMLPKMAAEATERAREAWEKIPK